MNTRTNGIRRINSIRRNLRIAFALTVGLLALGGALALLGAWRGGTTPVLAQGGERYVAPTGSDADNDCTDSSAPCATVQHAVDEANREDEILVATGAYTDVQARAGITQVAYISKSLTLRGGYSPGFTETSPISYPTTLDAEESGRVLYVTGSGITVTVEGLSITGGLANDAWGGGIRVHWDHAGAPITVMLRHNIVVSNTASGDGYGGGLCIAGAAAMVISNTIRDNDAAEGGGGAYLRGDAPIRFISNTVQSNTAAVYGGGIGINDAYDAALIDNDILSNTVSGGQGGGGVRIAGGTNAVLDDNLIAGNRAESRGGGVRAGSLVFGGLRFEGNVIRDNVASGSYGWGGGVYIDTGVNVKGGHTLEGNIIRDNVVTGTNDSGGGGLYLYNSVTLRNNAVIGNHAGAHGGGMYLNNTSLSRSHLRHTTLASNTAGDGSGVYVHVNDPAFTNTIIYSQTVGVYNDGSITVEMSATLWEDIVTQTVGPVSTSGDITTGAAAFSADGYHLTGTSDAIDAGLTTDVSTDVDGQFRSMGPAPDLGADEYPYYADLGLTKTQQGGGAVAAGVPITYTLAVSNSASAEWQADGSLVDTFEPVSALDSVTVAVMTGDECQVSDAVVTCTLLGVLTDTTRTVTVTAVTTDTFDGMLTNTAFITHIGGAIDESAGNNTGGPIAVPVGLRNIYLPLVLRNFQ